MLPAVLVTVYSRLDSLKECIQSLRNSEGSSDFVLYVSSDAAYCEEDKEAVSSVRAYISSITGFSRVVPLIHENNLGSWQSIHTSVDLILLEFDSFIFLEDDVVVGKNFLKYMSMSLDVYRASPKISFICSYIWPDFIFDEYTKEDVFLWRGYCPWGMATWGDEWKRIDFELKKYPEYLSNARLQREFAQIDPDAPLILKDDRDGVNQAMDVRICFNLFMDGKFSLFPVAPLSVNRGHDGRGEHKSNQYVYMEQLVSDRMPELSTSLDVIESVQSYIYSKKYSFLRHGISPFLKKIGIFDSALIIYKYLRRIL